MLVEDFECFQHKEIINVKEMIDYSSFSDFIIICCIHELKCHTMLSKYVQQLCQLKIMKIKNKSLWLRLINLLFYFQACFTIWSFTRNKRIVIHYTNDSNHPFVTISCSSIKYILYLFLDIKFWYDLLW